MLWELNARYHNHSHRIGVLITTPTYCVVHFLVIV